MSVSEKAIPNLKRKLDIAVGVFKATLFNANLLGVYFPLAGL